MKNSLLFDIMVMYVYIYMQYNVVLECTRWLNVYGTVYIYICIFFMKGRLSSKGARRSIGHRYRFL